MRTRGSRAAFGCDRVVTNISFALLLVLVTVLARPSHAAQCRDYEIQANSGAPAPLEGNPTHKDLVDAVAWTMRHKLALPLPAALRVYFCADGAALVEELSQIASSSGPEAWWSSAAAVAMEGGVVFRDDRLAQMQPATRAGLMAHELTHVSQLKLMAGTRVGPPLWLLEGHAEWVRLKVLGLLELRTEPASRAEIAEPIVGSKDVAKRFPDLRMLESQGPWLAQLGRIGDAGTYGQAFLAVDWLIERYGSSALLKFLGQFGSHASNPRELWRRSFPISYDYFVDDFGTHLMKKISRSRPVSGGCRMTCDRYGSNAISRRSGISDGELPQSAPVGSGSLGFPA
ncbi:MAG TPA: hypothetical protein VFV05_24735 [Methylomirabilota bacterium]|nr:hypothetical protein [Methylomirabilota bacterium]